MREIKKTKLPTGWQWEKIKNHIADFRSGLARGEKSRKEGFPHLRMNNISNNMRLDLSLLWRIPASTEEVETYSVRNGDILFNNTNSSALVGKSCLFNYKSSESFLFSNHLTRIRTKSSLEARYLLYWINVLWQWRYFEDKCDKWVNQAAIRVEDLLFPIDIPLPPTVEDQISIVNDIENKMTEVEKMRKAAIGQQEAAESMQRAILRDMFNAHRNSNWEFMHISDISDIIMGQSPSGSTYNKEAIGKPLLNGPTEFGAEHPTPTQWTTEPKKNCHVGDLIVCVRGNTTGRMNWADQEYCLGRGVAGIRGKEGKGDTSFIKYVLQYKINELLAGSERSTFPNLEKDVLKSFKVFAPKDLGTQKTVATSISEKLTIADNVKLSAGMQLVAIEALPAAILREVFDFKNRGNGAQ